MSSKCQLRSEKMAAVTPRASRSSSSGWWKPLWHHHRGLVWWEDSRPSASQLGQTGCPGLLKRSHQLVADHPKTDPESDSTLKVSSEGRLWQILVVVVPRNKGLNYLFKTKSVQSDHKRETISFRFKNIFPFLCGLLKMRDLWDWLRPLVVLLASHQRRRLVVVRYVVRVWIPVYQELNWDLKSAVKEMTHGWDIEKKDRKKTLCSWAAVLELHDGWKCNWLEGESGDQH